MASLVSILGIPDAFVTIVLILGLIVMLAPYAGGLDFGIFKVPNIESLGARKTVKIVGPILFLAAVFCVVPVIPTSRPAVPVQTPESPGPSSDPDPAVKVPDPIRILDKRSVFRGVEDVAIYENSENAEAGELKLKYSMPVAPDRIWIRFVQSFVQYRAYFGEKHAQIYGMPDEFYEMADWTEVQATYFDFEHDGNPELIFVLTDRAADSDFATMLKGAVVKYFGASNLDDIYGDEIFRVVGRFEGQSVVRIESNKLSLPIGSQGDSFEFRWFEGLLREWDASEEKFVVQEKIEE